MLLIHTLNRMEFLFGFLGHLLTERLTLLSMSTETIRAFETTD